LVQRKVEMMDGKMVEKMVERKVGLLVA